MDDVITLVQAGLSEDLITAKIVQNGKAFDLSTSQLLQLKKAGASDNVIRTMMNPNQNDASKDKNSVQPQSPNQRTEQKLTDNTIANIPVTIKTLIFGSDEFKRGVLLQLARLANRQEVADYKRRNAAHQAGNFPPLPPAGDIDMNLKPSKLLVSLGLIELDAVNEKFYRSTRYFAYDTPRLAQHTVQVSQDYLTKGYRQIKIAERVLEAVTYTNTYKINPLGTGERQAFAVTFSYRLKETIPGFPRVTRLFDGKAIAIMDPSDGQWKLEKANLDGIVSLSDRKIALSDRGEREYVELIEKPNFKIPERGTAVPSTGQSTVNVPREPSVEQRREDVPRAAETLLKKYPDARSFQVRHDHGSGALATDEERWRFCEGVLYVFQNRVKYEVSFTKDEERHDFDSPFAEIREAKPNRWPIIKYKGFHVRLNSGQNYNFAFPGLDPAQVLAAFPAALR